MAGPQFELMFPVRPKLIFVELFEFLCIKLHSFPRAYKLLPRKAGWQVHAALLGLVRGL